MLHITVGILTIVTQLISLVVFHYWRGKEPFVVLFVALAINSLLKGLNNIPALIDRILQANETPGNDIVAKLSIWAMGGLDLINLTLLVAISVDRWLSVEFAVRYRAMVSTQKLIGLFGLSYVVALTIFLPGCLVYWPAIVMLCSRASVNRHAFGSYYDTWRLFLGPLELVLLLGFQLRICMIAVAVRVRRSPAAAAVVQRGRTRCRPACSGCVYSNCVELLASQHGGSGD